MTDTVDFATTEQVRNRCLCLAAQRAAPALARRFDAALRPVGLTNGQYSLLHAINRPEPPRLTDLAPFLAMDRTTLTAALKVLEREGLVTLTADPADRRNRRLRLTDQGRARLARALPLWTAAHDALEAALPPDATASLGRGLAKLAQAPATE